eukprot:UN24358
MLSSLRNAFWQNKKLVLHSATLCGKKGTWLTSSASKSEKTLFRQVRLFAS